MGDRVPKGAYKTIVKEAEVLYNLDEGTVKRSTFLKRLQQNRKTITAGKGNVSPLLRIKGHLVDMLLMLASMRQPVTALEALNLINSMVETSELKNDIIKWKEKHLPDEIITTKDGEKTYLGKQYWRNFKKRHPELKTKKAVRFDSNREDWCTYENFETMYKLVYQNMVKSRVAIELEEEVMLKSDGAITQNPEEQVGRKTKFVLTRPEFVFFVDEVGCNTSQKNDGNVGGQKFLVQGNQQALIWSSFQDCHFTVLGFTLPNQDDIMEQPAT